MSVRRALGGLLVGTSLLVAACSGGSGDSADDSPASTAAAEPAPTNAPATPPTTSDPEALTYAELATLATDGEIDEVTLVLSEFSALFGVELPGATALQVDASLPTLGTDVLHEIERLDDRLTDEQRSIIAERLDEVLTGEVVYDTRDDASYRALFGEEFQAYFDDAASTTEPEGFAPRPRQVDEMAAGAIAATAAGRYVLELGGRPLLMSVSVAPAEIARTTTVDGLTTFGILVGAGVRTCTIHVYDRERNRDAHLFSVVGHEVFHCWQHTNASSDTAADAFAGFYKEGLATWVGEQFVAGMLSGSGSDFGWGHLDGFFEPTDFSLYAAKYTAYGFWSQVAELRGGSDALWSIIPALNAIGTDGPAVFDLALEGVDDVRRAQLAATAVREPDWSPAWNFRTRGVPEGARAIQDRIVRPGIPVEKQVSAAQQAIVRFDLSGLDADTNWIVSRVNTGLTYNRLDDFDEYATRVSEQTRFCYGEACVCPDGSPPFSDLLALPRTVTALTVALTGSSSDGASVSVEATDVEESCEDEPVDPTVPPDSGAFTGNGTWRATNPALQTMFTDASAFGFGAEPLSIAGVSGDLLMELRSDGTGTLTYRNVNAFINDGPLENLMINGTGSFLFGVEAGVLTVSGNTFEIAVSSGSLPDPIVITQADIEGGIAGTSTFTAGLDGDQLVLTGAAGSRGPVFFPTLWTRVD